MQRPAAPPLGIVLPLIVSPCQWVKYVSRRFVEEKTKEEGENLEEEEGEEIDTKTGKEGPSERREAC